MVSGIDLVKYDDDFLKLSWNWLNDPEIKFLTNTSNFTKENQQEWFCSLPNKNNYRIWGICFNNKKIGVTGLKNIEPYKAEYFGYIGEKEFWNKGFSKHILDCILLYSKNLGIKEIWLSVIKNNSRAIKAYEKYGFKIFQERDGELLMKILL